MADNGFPQIFPVEVRVYLGSYNGFVAQHFLDRPEICTPVDQVCCEGVPEGMRTDLFFKASPFGELPDDRKNHDPGELPAAPVQEKNITVAHVIVKHRIPVGHILIDLTECRMTDWDQSLLIPFPDDPDISFIPVNV